MTDHRVVVALTDRDALDQCVAQLPDAYDVETTTSLGEARTLLSNARIAFLDRSFFPDAASPAAWLETVDPDCRVALVTSEPPAFDPVRAGFDTVVQRPLYGERLRGALVRLLRLARYDDLIREYATRAEASDCVETVRRALDGVVSQLDGLAYKAAVRDPVVETDSGGRRKERTGSATLPAGRRAP